MPKKIIALGSGIVIAVVAVALVLARSSGQPVQATQDGLRGHWTAVEKSQAQSVLTAVPVSESPVLASCVVSLISEQNDYSQFQKYAQMAKIDNFDRPDNDQSEVIASLMRDALSCPEGN